MPRPGRYLTPKRSGPEEPPSLSLARLNFFLYRPIHTKTSFYTLTSFSQGDLTSMTRTIKIDPLSRIEGHLKIETRLEGDRVAEARVAGQMYRGLETLLVGRHPFDAARITQRTCGICHEVHGVASVLALEDLFGIEAPPNGRLLRDLILGLHLVGDHLFHFYQLCLPDYLDFSKLGEYRGRDERLLEIGRWVKGSGTRFLEGGPDGDYLADAELTRELALGYFEALRIRKESASGLAILGGKVPFAHALMPGGLTAEVTAAKLLRFSQALRKTAEFIESCYLPQVLALAGHFKGYFAIGRAHDNFYCNEGFGLLDAPLFAPGILIGGEKQTFRPEAVTEAVSSSYIGPDGGIDPDRAGAYSWIKSPRYGAAPMEVGPLARLAVNGDREFQSVLATFGQTKLRSSVMARLVARALESKRICRHLFALLDRYRLEEPCIVHTDLSRKVSGEGKSYSIAARGALCHMVEADKGRVTRYRMLVPSTWNFGPAAGGFRGVAEEALVGTRVSRPQSDQAIELGRVVRSLDPCIACAIH